MNEVQPPYRTEMPPVDAILVEEPRPRRRRLRFWTPFVAFVTAIVMSIALSIVSIGVGMMLSLGPMGARDLVVEMQKHAEEAQASDEEVEIEIGGGVPIVDENPDGSADAEKEDVASDDEAATDDDAASETDDEEESAAEDDDGPWNEWLISFATTPVGFAFFVLPGQIAFLGTALVFALLSPVPWKERLALRAPREPWPVWMVYVLAAPAATFLANLPMSMFVDYENSETLAMFEKIFSAGDLSFFLVVLAGVAILPAIGEEFLFRGYMQSRFAKVWPAWVAILVSASLFGLAHFDPIQSLGVIPLGIWIGVVLHRTRSLYPAMACHFCNNAYAVIASRLSLSFIDLDTQDVDLTRWELYVAMAMIFSSLFFFALASVYLVATGLLRELTTIEPAGDAPVDDGKEAPAWNAGVAYAIPVDRYEGNRRRFDDDPGIRYLTPDDVVDGTEAPDRPRGPDDRFGP